MKKYKLKIKGIHPIIWNVMKKEIEVEKKEIKHNELSDWEEANWRKKAEYDETGKVIIPDRWMKSNLIDSCKRTRLIPNFSTSKKETYTQYCQSFMIFNKKSICTEKQLEYYGAYVGAQGKNSNTKVWRVRPMLKKWNAEFDIVDPAGRMTLKELRTLVEYGGMFIGLGDNRINNFGRFDIISLEESK